MFGFIYKFVFGAIVLKLVQGSVLRNGLYKLDIVHYNDFHARFEESSVSYPVCVSNDTSCLGGFARLYHAVHTLLLKKPDALLLNAGDTFQGTYWYTFLKWNITQQFINMLPNDAHALGNHEFDDGIPGLAPYLAALRAPLLAANIDTTLEPALKDLYKPHTVLERCGRKIGIIGLTTTESKITSRPGNVIFLDPIDTVKKEAQALTDAGVDIIIVLSHCGLDIDKKIAKEVGENIDIIVGGHSHSLLWNGNSPSGENVSGPYPVLIETETNPDHKVLIVTAACFTKYVGNITTYFDSDGDLQAFEGEPVFLNRSIAEDENIKSLLKPYADKLHTLLNSEVGYTNGDLLATSCGSQECAIGDVLADSFVHATKQLNISSSPHVGFILRNMIRGSIPKGVITKGDLVNTLPFGNRVMTFSLLGRYLVDAFKLCMTNFWVKKPFQGPWVPQVSGLRLTLNLTDDVAVKVLIKEGDEYYDLDPDKEYQVTTVDFIGSGGNGFDMLKKHGKNKTIVGKDTDVFERYIKHITPFTQTLDKRLTIIN